MLFCSGRRCGRPAVDGRRSQEKHSAVSISSISAAAANTLFLSPMCDVISPLIASCSCCRCSLTSACTRGFPAVCSSRPQLCCFVLKQSVIWCTLADLLLNDALLRCCLCNLVFLQFLNFNINTFIIVRIEATTAKASCSRFPSKPRKSKSFPSSFCFNFVINPVKRQVVAASDLYYSSSFSLSSFTSPTV